MLYITLFCFLITACDGGLYIRKNKIKKVEQGSPYLVQGETFISKLILINQTYFSFMETPPDRLISADYYFNNLKTKQKIYPANIMYVKTSKGLIRMPNIKAYTLADNVVYYDNNLYFIFPILKEQLLTDCKIGLMKDSAIYIAKWTPKDNKFIIDHTSQYDYNEWVRLDKMTRQSGKPANESIYQIQHAVPFDCSQPINQGKPLDAININEID